MRIHQFEKQNEEARLQEKDFTATVAEIGFKFD